MLSVFRAYHSNIDSVPQDGFVVGERLKCRHMVDAFQGAHNPQSFLKRYDGGPFAGRHEFVRDHAHDEHVPQLFGPLQQIQVSDMEQVPTTSREDYLHVATTPLKSAWKSLWGSPVLSM